jgi:DNA-binding NarL/FixJ family response regulator
LTSELLKLRLVTPRRLWLDVGVTKAVVIDEWALLRAGIGVELAVAGVESSDQASTATAGFETVSRIRAGLLVVGSCPDSSVLDGVRRAHRDPGLKVIALVGSTSQRALVDLCSAGAHAVVPRAANEPGIVTAAARSALRGERYLAPELLSTLFAAPVAGSTGSGPAFPLTRRERSVLRELAAGRSNREIATTLCIGSETVKTHLGNIYAKLAVSRRDQAISVAIQGGLV